MIVLAALTLFLSAAEAEAEKTDAGEALIHGLDACAQWILDPATWMDGVRNFPQAAGLPGQLAYSRRIKREALPPPTLRLGMHGFRLSSPRGVDAMLVVSDRMPMCHLSLISDNGLNGVIDTLLSDERFSAHWEIAGEETREGLHAMSLRSVSEPDLTAHLTYRIGEAVVPGVQVVATAQFDLH